METLKLTPIDELEDMADGVPVLAVSGTVEYAAEITRGTAKKTGNPWNKQFFVLASETSKIACSMWDADGNELAKGEQVRIENTQNKKGQWSGMTKGSYQKDGERKHTLEIRANQVKIKVLNAEQGEPNYGSSNVPVDDQSEMPPAIEPELPLPLPNATRKVSMLDEKQRCIIRQHSQSMALEVLKLKVTLNELTVEDLTPAKLKTLANYFDNDVIEAAQ